MTLAFEDIGPLCDLIPGAELRTPSGVAGRVLEEAVELALACGMSVSNIHGHIADSVFNQCTKVSHVKNVTVFPSELMLAGSNADVEDEMADVLIALSDLRHVMGCSKTLSQIFETKAEAFNKLVLAQEVKANRKGLLYRSKPHIKEKS